MSGPSLPIDPVALARDLLRCPSVTPADGGAQSLLADVLEGMGFRTVHLPFGPVEAPTPNLYARLGEGHPLLCFAGHTDVVPPGDGWAHDPFAAEIQDDRLYGRGIADMKGGVACFVAAVARRLEQGPLNGSIALLITGDEEGPAHFGTKPVIEWLAERNELPDFCLLGEPTNPQALGDVIKIGRRGSMNAVVTVAGTQGHVAYPHLADNPVHRLLAAFSELTAPELDQGSEWFEPSSLQVTSIDVGNMATNVIPGEAVGRLNIRFNDLHTGTGLTQWIENVVQRHAPQADVAVSVSGEAFLTQPGPTVACLSEAVRTVTGRVPKLDTGGGTSDARFISRYCDVAEFGLVGATMHKRDEHVELQTLEDLTRIYLAFMEGYGV
ncbi:succinyl-diaminopimelate desuccinylase [Gluconobacter kanchanaburiensis]|uniref:Succinyl-diaminopimelate desuccinylase n=1 Tax=Gluconobacter kanchanaburiensis NBRC 103587 TaxID=1307948 RepID=A0A511B3M3_9PROT|nr:succinyl-diaminopimelate desuccinylase [Gluconobacter kanchanaburiensis]MBF0860782.1 succinyl-diaminopimelate desuccinylase [Gluconobacter kanchanaburiensis]GBR69785.1 succinyl-diaminopimelate desuccinylase [Gluconobacter kanchanaburiensis NBRC 103587]GEK95040.1 succinyl-diaminopimelate desuccinylase [Gluconobacter kanchanaburiensis NBRC 103587]